MKLARRAKKLAKNAVVEVVSVRQQAAYKLRIEFSDGARRIIDFQPFLEASRNPIVRAYLEPSRFREFTIRDGDLMWGDYDLCFPIADLYENKI